MNARSGAPFAMCFVAAVLLLGCDAIEEDEDPSLAEVPVLIAPAPGAVLDNGCVGGGDALQWSFDWDDVPGADLYHLYVIRAGMNPAIDRADLTASDFTDHHFGWVPSENLGGWSWKVRARTNGVWRAWSGERPFAAEPVGTDCP